MASMTTRAQAPALSGRERHLAPSPITTPDRDSTHDDTIARIQYVGTGARFHARALASRARLIETWRRRQRPNECAARPAGQRDARDAHPPRADLLAHECPKGQCVEMHASRASCTSAAPNKLISIFYVFFNFSSS
ncbi:hypothetical protein EVAR_77732_1 [Eumeta japonica]|uniref:Uncharacterized protein n=1 Tax=Eumeta variegata TaxID=151549 RepID=A0A4C1TBT1_EUMVA|nr:hypothetical protein EVAR_77732_1 [Eumeta japonica]